MPNLRLQNRCHHGGSYMLISLRFWLDAILRNWRVQVIIDI